MEKTRIKYLFEGKVNFLVVGRELQASKNRIFGSDI